MINSSNESIISGLPRTFTGTAEQTIINCNDIVPRPDFTMKQLHIASPLESIQESLITAKHNLDES